MRSATLCMLLATTGLSSLISCGSKDSSLLLGVSNLPARAVKLSIKATLDGKSATMTQELDAPFDQVGVIVPQDAAGHLTLNLQAFDVDGCLQATGQVDSELPNPRVDLSVAMQAQSPRKCGNLQPCAAGMICPITPKAATANLWGLWLNSPNDIWAVGELATLVHYDGTSWTIAQAPATISDLSGVWGSGPSDVWAVGFGSGSNSIIHFDGTAWTSSSNGAVYELLGVHGTGPTDVWTVGRSSLAGTPGEFWHWNGTAWSRVTTGINGALTSVWAASPTDIYVSGYGGLFLRGNGTTWSTVTLPVSSDLYFVYGSAPSQIFIVGAAGSILKYDGSLATKLPVTPTYSATLYGIAIDGSTVYAVGNNGANGNFLKASAPFSGFTVSSPGTTVDLSSMVVGSNGIAWTCGASGFIGYLDTRP